MCYQGLTNLLFASAGWWAEQGRAPSSSRREKSVLEVGSGPTVTSIISASGWSESIICSDFLEGNRKKISHWLTTPVQEGQGPDVWQAFFQYVAHLENAAGRYEWRQWCCCCSPLLLATLFAVIDWLARFQPSKRLFVATNRRFVAEPTRQTIGAGRCSVRRVPAAAVDQQLSRWRRGRPEDPTVRRCHHHALSRIRLGFRWRLPDGRWQRGRSGASLRLLDYAGMSRCV